MNDFMLAILGAAAEFERELISERLRDGMARARKENKKIRKSVVMEQKGIKISDRLNLKNEGKSIREISQILKIKRSTVQRLLSQKPTPQN